MKSMPPTPKLPWDFTLLAFFVMDEQSALIMTYREPNIHPYVIHHMNRANGTCYWGHYFAEYDEAAQHFLDTAPQPR